MIGHTPAAPPGSLWVDRPSTGGQPGRPLHADVAELLAGATDRRPLAAADGKSGARLEAVTIAGRRFVLKHVGGGGDWVARATLDLHCRAVRVWASGLLDALPACLDHAVVDAAYDPKTRCGAVLQRDVGRWLVPPGDTTLPPAQHRRFIDHMAALHAAFWDTADHTGLLALTTRYLLFAPPSIQAQRAHGALPDPLRLVPPGWRRLAERAPRAAALVQNLLTDPSRLVNPLRSTPQTLLHGDWKAGNLGEGPDGRTILLDWAVPGPGPACADLAWYLAINAARLPETKEATIAAYRSALQRRGIDTAGWWDPQLALSLIGAFAMLGWEKALGDPDELGWWLRQVDAGARWLR